MRVTISNLVEALGVTLLLFAAFAWDWRAATALLGVLCVLLGYLLDGETT